jgi:hypothetical protein
MSQELATQNNVYGFLQKSLENQSQQGQALQLMLNRMIEIEGNVSEAHVEIKMLAKEIRDENRLLPAEVDDLYNIVRERSVSLAKGLSIEDEDEFGKTVGKIRRLMWRKLNKKFGTSKYIHIRRKDLEDVLVFVKKFRIEDHI